MTTRDTGKPPAGLAKLLRATTKKGVGVVAQAVGAAGAAFTVGGLAGPLWGLLVASVAVVVGGTLAEMS